MTTPPEVSLPAPASSERPTGEEAGARTPATAPAALVNGNGAPSRLAVVIQTSYFGDVILTTPLLAELAARGPVDVVTTPMAAPLLAHHPSVRSVIAYDKRGMGRGMAGLWRTAQALRARSGLGPAGADEDGAPLALPGRGRSEGAIAYLAQGSIRSGLLALLAGFRERVGFTTSAAHALYTRTVAYDEDQHQAERLWRLGAASPDTVPAAAALRPRLYPGPREVSSVDALLERAGHDGTPLVALAPGSTWATKRWPHFPALAAALASRHRLVVVGGTHDRELAAEIAAAVAARPGAVIDATGHLSVLAAAEMIGRCVAIVTNDSAPLHLASAMGTPTVAIFGPTVPAFGFGPLAPRHAIAGHTELPCRPCNRHGPRRCPLGHWRCMRELSPSQVEALLHEVMAGAGP